MVQNRCTQGIIEQHHDIGQRRRLQLSTMFEATGVLEMQNRQKASCAFHFPTSPCGTVGDGS